MVYIKYILVTKNSEVYIFDSINQIQIEKIGKRNPILIDHTMIANINEYFTQQVNKFSNLPLLKNFEQLFIC